MRCLLLLCAGAVLTPELPPYATDKPLREPVLLSDEIISAPGAHGPSFTRDGRAVYFAAERPPHGPVPAHNVLVVSRLVAGRWTPPAWLEFSGQHQEGGVIISPNGKRLYFWSYRAGAAVESSFQEQSDIWFVEQAGAAWGLPQRLPAPINSSVRDYTGSFAGDGTLFLTSKRDGGLGQGDVYCARPRGEDFLPPENLGGAINSPSNELGPAVTPDGRVLVFSSDRPGGVGDWDLYISVRKHGAWSPAKNLGPRINTVSNDAAAHFSPDGRYLFFNSERTGKTRIYQVGVEALLEIAAE